ncbi:DNA-3-methyladenine glycosylase family protein [Amaricoccus macauensis]|uniref:DNA-3-methyladenine glycosylase family protein n=1 Tax=Amaricoccus macauensis TaxID=57001 RepID=UPI003C7EA074
MIGRIVETPEDVAEGCAFLASIEPRFAEALNWLAPLPLRRKPDGFAELLSIIISQQVSVASAQAVWSRVEALGVVDADLILRCSDEDLRGCGLSRQKIRYAREIAESGIDFAALRGMSDDDLIARLVEVKGVGVWTAEIYAMFSLGRADVFAPGDLALRDAAHKLLGLEARPSEPELRALSLRWSPWRSVAARLLWEYYLTANRREGVR